MTQYAMKPGNRGWSYRTKKGVLPIGDSEWTTLPAGTVVRLSGHPQLIFKARTFVIESDSDRDIVIDDIRIGAFSHLVANGSLPVESFREENGEFLDLDLPAMQTNQALTLQFRNTGTFARKVKCWALGVFVE